MAAAGPLAGSGKSGAPPDTALEATEFCPDEHDPKDRAPRTPSPWDADGDVHPVLERFKRVRLRHRRAFTVPCS